MESKITTIEIEAPPDKIRDWNFFDEKVIRRLPGFKPVAENILGLRRRIIDRESVKDTPHVTLARLRW